MEDLRDEDGILELDVDGVAKDSCTTELVADGVVAADTRSTAQQAPLVNPPRHQTHRQQFSGRGRSSFPFSSICSFPRKNVQKVGGYHTKKLRRRQLLPPPLLEVPITLADARGHDALASAQVMGTSNIGLESK